LTPEEDGLMTIGYLMFTDVQTGSAQDVHMDEAPPESVAAGFDTWPTHKICEAVYLDEGLRRYVLDALRLPYRTFPPNYGLDITAVMRHAWRARSWQCGRDLALCAVQFLAIAGVAILLTTRGGEALIAVVIALGALTALTRRVMRWRKLTVWRVGKLLWPRIRRYPRRTAATATVLIVLCLLSLRAVAHLVRPWDLLIPAGGAVAIVAIGMLDAVVVSRRAKLCRDWDPSPKPTLLRYQAPPLPAALEERLREDGPDPEQSTVRADGRVILYNLDRRSDMALIDNGFVGSGHSLGERQINIDVTIGRLEMDGTRRKPKAISLIALHRTLENTFGKAALPGMWCGYRMYVDDLSLRHDRDLLSDINAMPLTHVPVGDQLRYLQEPTALKRTHLSVQVPLARWGSEIIVTLFIRGELATGPLTLHSDILILPDVLPRRPYLRGYPPTDLSTYFRVALHGGCTRIWREAILSPVRLLREAWMSAARCRYRWRTRREIVHGRVPPWGGISSIREDLAMGNLVVHPNALQDLDGVIAFLLQTMKAGLKKYLEDCDIDASSLDDDVRNVIHNQQNKIDQLHAKNVTFGTKARAGDTDEKPKPTSSEPK
jgi:hypothetical protein